MSSCAEVIWPTAWCSCICRQSHPAAGARKRSSGPRSMSSTRGYSAACSTPSSAVFASFRPSTWRNYRGWPISHDSAKRSRRALGRPPGTFIAAYTDNRKDSSRAAIEDSPLGTHLLETFAASGGSVSLIESPSEMLRTLGEAAGRRITRSPRWPKSPAMFGNELRRLAPQLRTHGIHVTFTKTRKTRLIAIESRRRSDYSPATP